MAALLSEWDDVRKFLREEEATLVSHASAQIVLDAELIRCWQRVPDKLAERMVEYLDLFTSVENEPTEQLYVYEPKATGLRGQETYPGRWRVVKNYRSRGKDESGKEFSSVFQVLHDGYVTELDWSNCRLMSCNGYTTDTNGNPLESYHTVQFAHVAPTHVKAIQEQLLALTSVANQTIGTGTPREYTLSGTWHIISVDPVAEADGIYVINALLAKPECTLDAYRLYGTASGETVKYRWGVPKHLAQDVIDAWATACGTGASATASYRQGVVDLQLVNPVKDSDNTTFESAYAAAYTETTYQYWGASNKAAYPLSSVPGYGTNGYTFDRSVSKNSNGTYDIRIVVKLAKTQNLTQYNVTKTKGYTDTERTHTAVANEATVVPPIPDNSTASDGVITNVRKNLRPDGLKDISVSARTLTRIAAELVTSGVASPLSYNTRLGAASIRVVRNATLDEIKTALSALTTGTNNSVSVSPGDAGLYDYTIHTSPVGGGTINWQEDYSYVVYETKRQTSGRRPGELAGVAFINPNDGYFWRDIRIEKTCLFTHSDTKARDHAKGGLIGSGSKHIRSGWFYAEKVTAYKIGNWQVGKEMDAIQVAP